MFNPGMFNNISPDQVKMQSELLKNMSDEDLKRQIDAAKGMMPPGNVSHSYYVGMQNLTPEMMRMASQSLGSMSEDQIKATLDKSKTMASASPSSNAQQAPPQRQPTVPSSTSKPNNAIKKESNIPRNDLERANQLKEDANQLVKAGQHDKGCEKYFEAINTLRFSEKFKNTPDGKAAEMACRLNIALCKHALGDYASVVDQCERVLSHDQNSWKAQFRISQALHAMVKQKNQSLTGNEMKNAVDFAKQAHEGNPSDAKVKEFYISISNEYEGKPPKPVVIEEEAKSGYAFVPAPEGSSYKAPPTFPGAVNPETLKNMAPEQKATLIKQNSERIKGMDDSQLKSMVDMMKNNKEQMRAMYRAQGMEMSDEQLEAFSNMMSPEMLKSASDMLSKNPDLINQVKPPTMAPTATVQSQQEVEESKIEEPVAQANQFQMPPNMGSMSEMMNNPMVQQMMNNPELMKQAASMMGGGGMDPSNMQSMMQNPSLSGMFSNPDFLSNTVNMLNDPRNKAMIDMLKQQNPNMNVDLMMKAMSGIGKLAAAYSAIRRAWANVFVRLAFFGLIVLLVAYYFG